MPRKYWPIWAMFGFVVAMVLLIGWLALWGVEDEKRSLSVRNLTQGEITVRVGATQSATIKSDRTHAFSIRPEQFPMAIDVAAADGTSILARSFTFEELKDDYDFRLFIAPDGIVTPVPGFD